MSYERIQGELGKGYSEVCYLTLTYNPNLRMVHLFQNFIIIINWYYAYIYVQKSQLYKKISALQRNYSESEGDEG